MKHLSTEQKVMAELHGHVLALRVCISALIASVPPAQQQLFEANLQELGEHQSAELLAQAVPEEVIQAFSAVLLSIKQTPEQSSS